MAVEVEQRLRATDWWDRTGDGGEGPGWPVPLPVPRSTGMRAAGQDKSSRAAPRLLTLQRHLSCPESSGQEPEDSPLTIHVLDTASGLPIPGLCLHLSQLEDLSQQWTELRKSYTDPDGHCPGLLRTGQMKPGTYKLSFDTEGYWKEMGQESFYPYVEIVFTIINETQKFQLPLLLSPWSYSTYRGSQS
ncbi:5-hydroxyisourate hydrolase-like isoform X2 [Marmota marmota marmota]|uniref:5-hydroxyisourate hydrolase n=1 Tax=Marmota marmota marmota TaxID=9994 RepID=A0A8C5Z9J3_MARMA|nr:5-hydroxyisourate hydrolase-like isoform X2 [Marmota marmota marmota]